MIRPQAGALSGAFGSEGPAGADLAAMLVAGLAVSGEGPGLRAQGTAVAAGGGRRVVDGAIEQAEAEVHPGGRVVLRRDAMGVRPLHYAVSHDGGRFAFASRVTQLDGLAWVDRSVDQRGLAHLLLKTGDWEGRTGIAGIRAVPPGHRLTWAPGEQPRITREWDPQAFLWAGGRGPARPVAEFVARLEEAVARRCPPGAGVLLSGGFDSTSVAAAAVRRGLRPRTFSAVYPHSPQTDESVPIRATQAALGVDGPCMEIADRGIDLVGEELARHGQPSGAPNYSNLDALLVAAARHGATVVLDGHDGDSALGMGLGLPRLLPARPALARALLRERRAAGAPAARVLGGWALACLPPPARRRLRGALGAGQPEDVWPTWLEPGVRAERGSAGDLPWAAAQGIAAHPLIGDSIVVLDLAAAAHGLQLLHPYADRELVEFLLSLPPEAKYADGRPKALVRAGFPELPASVQRPRRVDFLAAAMLASPFEAVAGALRATWEARVPGIDYEALDRRLDEGPPYRSGEFVTLRGLVAGHRFVASLTAPALPGPRPSGLTGPPPPR